MLLPKRVKYRRVHRGRMKGKATRGNTVTYGELRSSPISPSPRSRPRPAWVPVRALPSTGWPWSSPAA